MTQQVGLMPEGRQEPIELLETGVPNLDRVLGGGLRRASMTLVIGAPGTGKTILAQQIAFQFVERGAPALYLTGYSETHDKLLANGRGLSFFAPEVVGRQIQFLSLMDLLQQGAVEAEEAILATAREQRAALVVLDGFRSMRRLLADDLEAAHFLYSLGAKLALFGATSLVIVEGDADESARYPELTVCDAILSLRRDLQGTRYRRLLDVTKVRGAAPLIGTHSFTIGKDGITVYPRLESIVVPAEPSWTGERAGFALAEIDAMVGGGLTVGTTTLVAGSPGIGKTLLGLHFTSAGVRAQEAALFLGFMEDRIQLRAKARAFGLDLAAAEASGQVRLMILPPYELDADYVADLLCKDIEQRGVHRLVIDSVAELDRGLPTAERKSDFLAALITYLRGRDVTTYATLDINTIVGPTLEFAGTPLSVVAENLIVLRYAEYRNQLHRLISVLKIRYSNYDRTLREFTITEGRGIELLGPAPPAAGLLTGTALPLAEPTAPQQPDESEAGPWQPS
jgi:circadian clock protein KaiC